jgi:hypothetical protein
MGVIICICSIASRAMAQTAFPYTNDFEQYSAGEAIVDMNGTGQDGWAGEPSTGAVATATAASYTPVAGYPSAGSTHTQVMAIAGTVSNAFDTSQYQDVAPYTTLYHRVWVDTMLQAGYLDSAPAVPSDARMALYVNSAGHVCVYHATYPDDNSWSRTPPSWTEFTNSVISSSAWFRATIMIDYLSSSTNTTWGDSSDYEHFFTIKVDGGDELTTPSGFKTPMMSEPVTDIKDGPYLLCANSGYGAPTRPKRYFTGAFLQGAGMIDDFVATAQSPVYGGDTNPVDPIVTWITNFPGLTTNSLDVDTDGDGHTGRQEYYAGTNPTNKPSVMKFINESRTSSSNMVVWFGTTNNGPTAPFKLYRGTYLNGTGNWAYIKDVPRAANGTNSTWDTSPLTNGVYFYQVKVPESL